MGNIMDKYLLLFLGLLLSSAVHGEDRNTYKKDVILWYDAFTQNNPLLFDRILNDNWVDIPAPPGQPAGPAGAKGILVQLRTTFPDLKITIQDISRTGTRSSSVPIFQARKGQILWLSRQKTGR
jgi:hypothetical protein